MTMEAVGIFIGVATLLFGILSTRRSQAQTLQQHRLQAILSISDSFRSHWQGGWSDVLDELDTLSRSGRLKDISAEQTKVLRFMLNWVDWLGALSHSGAVDDLSILTGSLGAPLRRIINCGRPIIEHDVGQHGLAYWKNLAVVAHHLNVGWFGELSKAPGAAMISSRKSSPKNPEQIRTD